MAWLEGETLYRWQECRLNGAVVTTRVQAVPPELGQINPIQSVKAEPLSRLVHEKTLIAETSGNTVRTQQRGQQVTLGVAKPRPMPQDIGRQASYVRQLKVDAVPNFVPDPLEAAPYCPKLVPGNS